MQGQGASGGGQQPLLTVIYAEIYWAMVEALYSGKWGEEWSNMGEGWRQFLGVESELLGKWCVALPMDPTSAG